MRIVRVAEPLLSVVAVPSDGPPSLSQVRRTLSFGPYPLRVTTTLVPGGPATGLRWRLGTTLNVRLACRPVVPPRAITWWLPRTELWTQNEALMAPLPLAVTVARTVVLVASQ